MQRGTHDLPDPTMRDFCNWRHSIFILFSVHSVFHHAVRCSVLWGLVGKQAKPPPSWSSHSGRGNRSKYTRSSVQGWGDPILNVSNLPRVPGHYLPVMMPIAIRQASHRPTIATLHRGHFGSQTHNRLPSINSKLLCWGAGWPETCLLNLSEIQNTVTRGQVDIHLK